MVEGFKSSLIRDGGEKNEGKTNLRKWSYFLTKVNNDSTGVLRK